MSQHTKQTVWTVTKKIIFKLSNQKEETYDKATLAKVRKTLGKPLSEATEIWPILFENLPEEFLSSYQQPSYEELAIYTALQLYALHQQGVSTSVMLDDSKPYENIGSALGITGRQVTNIKNKYEGKSEKTKNIEKSSRQEYNKKFAKEIKKKYQFNTTVTAKSITFKCDNTEELNEFLKYVGINLKYDFIEGEEE